MVTKARAIEFRIQWLGRLDQIERRRLDPEETFEERAEYLAFQREGARRQLRALEALADDAPQAAILAACEVPGV